MQPKAADSGLPPPARPVATGPVLALDLGASRIRVAAVSPDGLVTAGSLPGEAAIMARFLEKFVVCNVLIPMADRVPNQVYADLPRQNFIDRLRGVLDALDGEARRSLAGIGIAAPGPVDPRIGTLIEPPNVGPGFRDIPLAVPIADALGLPVVLERDTHVAALGEATYGIARGVRDFLYLTVSTGIGGAIIANGELYGGADGVAGEIGHIPVDLDGPLCGCGSRGHLEAISSGSGIARQARMAIEAGTGTVGATLSGTRTVAARPPRGTRSCCCRSSSACRSSMRSDATGSTCSSTGRDRS